jgi:hypothetical protein
LRRGCALVGPLSRALFATHRVELAERAVERTAPRAPRGEASSISPVTNPPRLRCSIRRRYSRV